MIEGCQAMGSINEKLTFPSQVPQLEWLVEAVMNMNRHIITNTNEESLSMPSLLANLNNEVVHYYV
jgi:hypothetical protein